METFDEDYTLNSCPFAFSALSKHDFPSAFPSLASFSRPSSCINYPNCYATSSNCIFSTLHILKSSPKALAILAPYLTVPLQTSLLETLKSSRADRKNVATTTRLPFITPQLIWSIARGPIKRGARDFAWWWGAGWSRWLLKRQRVLKHRGKFIENPASSIYREADFVAGELRMISVHHTDAI